MQGLARLCVQRPVFASVLILAIAVLGIVGYGRLGVDQFPNVDIPIVVVTARLDGASPEEVELDITDKIEGAVNTISGIDELRSDLHRRRERRFTITFVQAGEGRRQPRPRKSATKMQGSADEGSTAGDRPAHRWTKLDPGCLAHLDSSASSRRRARSRTCAK